MTRILLVRWGQTEWAAQGRLTGDTDIPLTPEGRQQVLAVAEALRPSTPTLLFCGPEEPSRETAGLIGERLDLKVKSLDELREMDLGHWEGLTQTEFEERFPSVARQWREEPATVEPPEGESLPAMADRLAAGLAKVKRKAKTATAIVVTGPLAAAALQLRATAAPLDGFWERVDAAAPWTTIELAAGRAPRRAVKPPEA